MSPIDRVYSIATTVSRPAVVADIAAEANVSEDTTRAHLDRLVEMNVLVKRDEEGSTTYEPDLLYIRMQTLRDLLDEYDDDGLYELKEDLEDQIEVWRSKYNVQSPERLRERISDSTDSTTANELKQVANDWELVQNRLGLVREALFVCNDSTST